MPAAFPNPSSWCLKFKIHRTTILMHVDPLTKLSVLRTTLHSAIKQTHPTGIVNGYKIPENAEDIVLARPVDINDLTQGWEELKIASTGADTGKGKAKTVSKAGKGKAGGLTDCPQGAGLRDGGVVAIRFRTEAEKAKAALKAEYVTIDEDGFEDIGDVDVDEIAAKGVTAAEDDEVAKWDVEIAEYEEDDAPKDVEDGEDEAIDLDAVR